MRTAIAAMAVLSLMAPGSVSAQEQSASANMIDVDEQEAGTVTFNQTKSGFVHVIVEMTGIAAGPHGFHIHETGECNPGDGFKSAGGHLAGSKDHGVGVDGGPHPGDFPNVNVGQDGVLKVEFFTDRVTLGEGENTLMDEDGSAVVVHAGADDYASQPSGDSGDRIACGVIRQL